jgi:hypothetical protein
MDARPEAVPDDASLDHDALASRAIQCGMPQTQALIKSKRALLEYLRAHAERQLATAADAQSASSGATPSPLNLPTANNSNGISRFTFDVPYGSMPATPSSSLLMRQPIQLGQPVQLGQPTSFLPRAPPSAYGSSMFPHSQHAPSPLPTFAMPTPHSFMLRLTNDFDAKEQSLLNNVLIQKITHFDERFVQTLELIRSIQRQQIAPSFQASYLDDDDLRWLGEKQSGIIQSQRNPSSEGNPLIMLCSYQTSLVQILGDLISMRRQDLASRNVSQQAASYFQAKDQALEQLLNVEKAKATFILDAIHNNAIQHPLFQQAHLIYEEMNRQTLYQQH